MRARTGGARARGDGCRPRLWGMYMTGAVPAQAVHVGDGGSAFAAHRGHEASTILADGLITGSSSLLIDELSEGWMDIVQHCDSASISPTNKYHLEISMLNAYSYNTARFAGPDSRGVVGISRGWLNVAAVPTVLALFNCNPISVYWF